MLNLLMLLIVGSHQSTLKELSRVRHELLQAKTGRLAPAREGERLAQMQNGGEVRHCTYLMYTLKDEIRATMSVCIVAVHP